MTDVVISKKNHSFLKVNADPGIIMEMHEHFQFEVPGAKFTPKYRSGMWDGKIRLFNVGNRQIYSGLYQHIVEFCESRGYSYTLENSGYYGLPGEQDNVLRDDIEELIERIKPTSKGKRLVVRDYQIDAVIQALTNKNIFLISPTSSGKSLIQYIICRYLLERDKDAMIIVPTKGLVSQMQSDFADYSSLDDTFDAEEMIHTIVGGVEKNTNKPIVITTYQSVYQQQAKYFNRFDAIVIDEGHGIKAATITSILEKATEVSYRIGCSGTVHDAKCHALVLQGLTGKFYTVTTTKKLMDDNSVSQLKIKCIVLKHREEIRKALVRKSYQEEIDYLTTDVRRNKFIVNLTLSTEGTVLVLFQFVDKQGKHLYEMLKEKSEDREVYLVTKDTKLEEREYIRRRADEKPCIIVGSYGTMSTGTNIPGIMTIVFAHPSKAKIRILQSIGRSIRLKDGKDYATLYDIADDLSYKSYNNHTLVHLGERLKTYTIEKFQFTIKKIDF